MTPTPKLYYASKWTNIKKKKKDANLHHDPDFLTDIPDFSDGCVPKEYRRG
jgi:hypothetical protein